jgi:hypothetical protein
MDAVRMVPLQVLKLGLLLLTLGLGALWPIGSAAAQSASRMPASAAEPAGYKAAIDNAIEEFASNNLAEAREQFGRAHALFPNARTLRGLGMVEFELRNYAESIGWLRQALASEVKRLEGRLRAETEELLERANGYVGEVRLRVSPPGTSVSVDGVASEVSAQGSLVLAVGDHILEFRAEGRLSERRAFKLSGHQVLSMELTLTEPVEATPAKHGPSEGATSGPPSERTPIYKRWWLWTTVGVVLVGAGVTTALLLTADTKYKPVTTTNTPEGVRLQPLWSY